MTAFKVLTATAAAVRERIATAIENALTEDERRDAYLRLDNVLINDGRIDRGRITIALQRRPEPRG